MTLTTRRVARRGSGVRLLADWVIKTGALALEQRDGNGCALPVCRVVLNADDFGINPWETDATCEALAAGRITSATLMANGSAIDVALKAVPHFPNCSFGAHLNATDFEPLTTGAQVNSLLDGSGYMNRQLLNAKPSFTLLQAIYEEWCSQIQSLISRGVPVSHFDSHHHLHTLPWVLPIVKLIQKRFGIRRVRLSKNVYAPDEPYSLLATQKQLYNFMLRTLYETRTTLGFTDLSTFYRLGALGSIVHPSVEVMVHPGEHNNDAETHLLFSNWESALPYKIAKISYKEI